MLRKLFTAFFYLNFLNALALLFIGTGLLVKKEYLIGVYFIAIATVYGIVIKVFVGDTF
jgi:predicted tellurium resistance membrane protein TerC